MMIYDKKDKIGFLILILILIIAIAAGSTSLINFAERITAATVVIVVGVVVCVPIVLAMIGLMVSITIKSIIALGKRLGKDILTEAIKSMFKKKS